MTVFAALACALLVDAALGEPRWIWSRLPHPAVLMGRAVGMVDAAANRGSARRLRGAVAILALVLAVAALGGALALVPGEIVEIVVAAVLLAQRSLADHVAAVATALRRSVPEGRGAVAMIVGRDTAGMDGAAIARGAIESAAENLSDGVVAPAFWFLVAGLPGILVYKLVNTADSMIGYRTPRHAAFGRTAARLDDLLNLIPARLTALLILVAAWRLPRRDLVEDARRHRSPNAGWPEAAMAQALNVALSGPRRYHGSVHDDPFVNAGGARAIGAPAIDAAVRLLWRSWSILLAATTMLALA